MNQGFRKFKCKGCGKTVRESNTIDSFDRDNKKIEVEFIDLCKKCFKKNVKKQKQISVLMKAIQSNKITKEDVLDWKVNKKISLKEFWEKVNRKKGDLKKQNDKIKEELKVMCHLPRVPYQKHVFKGEKKFD